MGRFSMTTLGVLIVILISWALAFAYSKSKREEFPKLSQFQDSFFIIAHRGGALEAPENTLEAFTNANSANPRVAFELDIHFTKDKKIVVFHDASVERTTDGKGLVKDLTYDELSKLDAGFNFQNEQGEYSFRNKNVKIPLLEEVFEKFPNTRMIIEIKPKDLDLADALFAMVKKFNKTETAVVGSQHSQNVAYYRSLDKGALTSVTPDEMQRSLMLANMFLEGLDKMHPAIYAIPETSNRIPVLNERFMLEAQRRNKKVFIWTVNEKADMLRLKDFGVDGLITDRPSLLLNL